MDADLLEKERGKTLLNTKISAHKMIQRLKWAHDEVVYSIGDSVLLRIETGGNPKNKSLPLKDYQYDAPRKVITVYKDTLDLVDVHGIVELRVHKSRVIKVIQ